MDAGRFREKVLREEDGKAPRCNYPFGILLHAHADFLSRDNLQIDVAAAEKVRGARAIQYRGIRIAQARIVISYIIDV
jgi:hypothetical protein